MSYTAPPRPPSGSAAPTEAARREHDATLRALRPPAVAVVLLVAAVPLLVALVALGALAWLAW